MKRRIACIGAGSIADTHAAVLHALGIEIAAIVEPQEGRAAAFARKWNAGRIYREADALIADGGIDAVHILVPPPLHMTATLPFLRAGISVLLEKPMAQSAAECEALQQAAAASGARFRVNHNAVHYPAHLVAKRLIATKRVGPVRHVECRFNLPLRQLGLRQLGHWMFDVPVNLLLEQAVHPLSQLDDLVGPVKNLAVLAPPPSHISEGREVFRRWLVSLECEHATAQLQLSLGETYSSWTVSIIGDDGVIAVDYLNNRVACEASGPRMEVFDSFENGARIGLSLQWQSLTNLLGGVLSTVKLRPRSDVFYRSMMASIANFHRDSEAGSGDLSGARGRRMVELCEVIADRADLLHRTAPSAPAPRDASGDVLVIGGTGFIGAHVVERLVASGRHVRVLARTLRNLPTLFEGERVTLVRGDARSKDDIARAIGDARCVVNLAHGGGGDSRAEIEASLVGSAKTVAAACLERGVAKLVYISSIASLYLGDPADIVTGATPPDPEFDARGDYSRAKVLAEQALIALRAAHNLPVVILRPGVVIGDGGAAFHSGVGFYNHENHCLGWNRGLNPLPLVLVGEVADGIMRALDVEGVEGKCYNLVGGIRLTAREYIAELARVTGRNLHYHPQSVEKLYAIELGKTLIKRLAGRREPSPTLRDLKSRGLVASFDCSDTERDLGWHPVRERAEFLRQGFECHGNGI